MRLTPMDVEKQRFTNRMRGYDHDEVHAFLSSVAREYEQLVVENHHLADEIAHLKENLDEHRGRERILRETLVTAQRVTEDMKEEARKEGRLIVREASIKADQIIEQAQGRVTELATQIRNLEMEREAFELKLRNIIDHHLKILDLRAQEEETQGTLEFMPRVDQREG